MSSQLHFPALASRSTIPVSARRERSAAAHVMLLRGINVGGKHMLPMSALTTMLVDAGCQNVRTYIQSGNVVLDATASLAKKLPSLISQRILDEAGFQPHILMRTGSEVAEIVARNPFQEPGIDPGLLLVGFLQDVPPARMIKGLDPDRSPGDRFAVRGREIYLHLRCGVAKSKLTYTYIEATLGTLGTFRNWRTALKIAEIVASR
jgi:uncharacterized protein (DUF1697 family)